MIKKITKLLVILAIINVSSKNITYALYHENLGTKEESERIKSNKLLLIKGLLFWDILDIAGNINKINTLGSNSAIKISEAANLELANIIPNIYISFIKALIYANNTDIFYDEYSQKFIIHRLLHFLPDIANFKFAIDNAQIINNAKSIAQYNKSAQRNLSKAKKNQYIWLIINKIYPYLMFIIARKNDENCKIKDILSNPHKIKSNTLYKMEIFRIISNISEIIRKISLYRLEKGEYKKYQTNSINKNKL